ncbi:SgcJ/EcaC family oxidoreductase [Microbacterium stercoris]|uniref:SgcJ/EcaC family oxidoreductase n=1 Tax=Microbacterium stercoris TaxID=2820289 RepID=A0A939QN39_9MICO|nr:SgcJ/EcaC family oxidoreductase [Microbacterium stercoris]MBO3662481.1 SgcJ/EcaC family oxidoreductase [Microbacterium stercoris]MBO3664473.1 SgcJ/EcaC family oxidoreductase [Microbacterium stercoris]
MSVLTGARMDPESVVIVQPLLDAWAAAIADGAPTAVAALFTPDALLQGFDPAPGFGRASIEAYYAKQPAGLRADVDLLVARPLGPDSVLGYAHVVFHRPEGPVPVHLTAVAERTADGWLLSHYHVSRITLG